MQQGTLGYRISKHFLSGKTTMNMVLVGEHERREEGIDEKREEKVRVGNTSYAQVLALLQASFVAQSLYPVAWDAAL